MQEYVIPLTDTEATLERVGGKGASLARLAGAGLPVPDGYHVTTAAYRQFVAENGLQPAILAALEAVDAAQPATLDAASQAIAVLFAQAPTPPAIASAIARAYEGLPGANPAVAVRSSATAEDLPEASFAGQQETYLNVSGADAVLEATRKCWASLWTARAIGYRARQGIAAADVALAVVVQLLVPAEAAGVLFTADPVSGRRDKAVISAAWGLGESVVGGEVTPDTVVVDKASGRVVRRETADKQVMTVRVGADGGTAVQPVPERLRRAPVLGDEDAAELVSLASRIEALLGMPMDVEWALAGDRFSILQARPITALPEVEPVPPDDWRLPAGSYIAMRNNIVELMADPLTPLFSTLGLSCINTSMGNLLAAFFGRRDIMPESLIVTVNQYAYYNGSVSLGAMMRILLHAGGIMRRMFTGAVERWTEVGRPRYVATVQRWQNGPWRQLPATSILAAARELSEAAIDAYGALVSGVIPAAWISEGLFTAAYALLKRRDDPPAPTYLLGFDSAPIRAEKSLYDLARWAHTRADLASYIRRTSASRLAAQLEGDGAPPGVGAQDWAEWRARTRAYLEAYGHAIYNLDFANPVPADDPGPSLEALKLFLVDEGSDPHARQQASAERREQATRAMERRLRGLRLKLFRRTLAVAQRYAPLREDGLADIGLSYPLLRQMLRELGRRFAGAGMIERPDDIFWLQESEVERATARLDRQEPLEQLSAAVAQRRASWRAAGRLTPPMSLMRVRLFGRDLALGKQPRTRRRKGTVLKGVAASPGVVTGRACVVHGPEEFSRMETGDVLVAPLTTPAWTPLFARAAAVVTDVGGPLSHGSIVAREYGIPAVLGTGAATRRIRTGDLVRVDGRQGLVELLGTERKD